LTSQAATISQQSTNYNKKSTISSTSTRQLQQHQSPRSDQSKQQEHTNYKLEQSTTIEANQSIEEAAYRNNNRATISTSRKHIRGGKNIFFSLVMFTAVYKL
jgi:hypothetical protein